MNRITFIKRVLGIVGVTAVALAVLTRSESEGVDTSKYIIGCDPYEAGGDNTIMMIIDKRDKEILYGSNHYVGNIRWKESRKVGKLEYLDNNGVKI